METGSGMIQVNDSLTQPGIIPSDNVDNSDRDQSQSPTDFIPSLTDDVDDVDACELTNEGKRKKTSDVWDHSKGKQLKGRKKLSAIIVTKL